MRVGDGTPGPGRPKGSKNRVQTQAKEAIAAAAEGLGGIDRLVAWAMLNDKNEAAFWTTIYPRLVPLEVNGTQDVNIVDRTEQLQRVRDEVRSIFGERSGLGAGDGGRGLPN